MVGGKPVKLPSLHVRNFRMLEDFTLEKLGRVNLLVGGNNSGKSTVLEAVRVYAGNGVIPLLQEIAASHNEVTSIEEASTYTNVSSLPFDAFFTGRNFLSSSRDFLEIGINEKRENSLKLLFGYTSAPENVSIGEENFLTKEAYSMLDATTQHKNHRIIFRVSHWGGLMTGYHDVTFIGMNRKIPWADLYTPSLIKRIPCAFVPTGLIHQNSLALDWEKMDLSPSEDTVLTALKIIDKSISGIKFETEAGNRVAKVRVGSGELIPLRSMGEGVYRLLQLAMNACNAQGGFLLIDEFENGLHYSIQEKVWEMVFALAEELDIQVFATTHSRDCINSFAAVANRNKVTEGMLIRMGRSAFTSDNNKVIGTPYTAEELDYAAAMHLDVR